MWEWGRTTAGRRTLIGPNGLLFICHGDSSTEDERRLIEHAQELYAAARNLARDCDGMVAYENASDDWPTLKDLQDVLARIYDDPLPF